VASNIKARATWERQAVGSQRSNAPPGTQEYYQQIKEYRYGYETPFIPKFFNFGEMSGKRVLEVGVGNGIDALEIMKKGASYTGIDITRNHIDLTRRYIELELMKGKPLIVEGIIEGDLLQTELTGGYDVIYSFGVLHHIAHEEEYLIRMRQLMAKDGQLLIAVYARYSFFNLWMILTWVVRNRMRYSLADWQSHLAEGSILGEPVVIKIRNRKEIQSMLEIAGFKILRYKRKGFVQNYIPGIGRLLAPDGIILNLFAFMFGWYHCFICSADK